MLATGGMDHAVRLWNPYVTSKPIAYIPPTTCHHSLGLGHVQGTRAALQLLTRWGGQTAHTHTHTPLTPPHTPDIHTHHTNTHTYRHCSGTACVRCHACRSPSHTSRKHTKTTVKRVPSGSLLLISPRNTVALTCNKIMLRMITIG